MLPENIMMIIAFMAATGAVTAYAHSAVVDPVRVRFGRFFYTVSVGFTVVLSAYFWMSILANRFDIEYIALNSSRSLPLAYKVSVFWAGQQGSLLFWCLAVSLMGIVLLTKARKLEAWAMVAWSSTLAMLFGLLLKDSPFSHVSGSLVRDMTGGAGFSDGLGLSELLQSPWMVVHPPVMFVGYAAISIPAALAVAALAKGDFSEWRRSALPWVAFGWTTLSAGIILGAYWSYEVLGWGGYWAWDPVENASLIPWLLATALLHTLSSKRACGSYTRLSIILSLVTYLTILYAAFLTRSGVLGDLSVHTFGTTGAGSYFLQFIVCFLMVSAALVIWRWRKMGESESGAGNSSNALLHSFGIVSLCVLAGIVFIGTSAPILAKSFNRDIAIDRLFYDRTVAPVAFLMVALIALTTARRNSTSRVLEFALQLAVLVVFGVLVGLFAGGPRWYFVVAGASVLLVSIAALAVNSYALIRNYREKPVSTGGLLSHFGVALMILGIVLSANGGRKEGIMLPKGEPVQVTFTAISFPRIIKTCRLTYEGMTPLDERKAAMMLTVNNNGRKVRSAISCPASSVYADSVPAKPLIIKSRASDLYIAPERIPTPMTGTIEKGETVALPGFALTFNDLEIPDNQSENEVQVGANLRIQTNGKTQTVTPWLTMRHHPSASDEPVQLIHPPVPLPGTDSLVEFCGVSSDTKYIMLAITSQHAAVSLSTKPYIGLMWLGAVVAVFGGVVATLHTMAENRRIHKTTEEVERGQENAQKVE